MEFLFTGFSWFILWTLCIVISTEIAERKGNSKFVGFLLGFFLGILGIIFSILMSPNPEKQRAYRAKTKNLKECPDCAELIQVKAKKCRFCNFEFTETQETKSINPSVKGNSPRLSSFLNEPNSKGFLDRIFGV